MICKQCKKREGLPYYCLICWEQKKEAKKRLDTEESIESMNLAEMGTIDYIAMRNPKAIKRF